MGHGTSCDAKELFTPSIAPALYMRTVKIQQNSTGKDGDYPEMPTDMRRFSPTNAQPQPEEPFYTKSTHRARDEVTMALAVSDVDSFPMYVQPWLPSSWKNPVIVA
ncbi:hypothetical protein TNIN_139571 [Trichonephila inaurata madagascariensis]|uniref:Uncharacterized protein n=1 Tax=Trichonephila inaurata madagascariensis TaxID=2747483 RepID=A0A8X6XSY3_9ARAC|nr:hypothetical protein TNIN_139571 [Trichonephila inaurata madagascariensis]